jgi:RNA-binding protein MEX3
VFVVTGRKEDVGAAKREILSAAEHFSQIRASRRNNNQANGCTLSGIAPGPPSPNAPGQVTIQVRVPYRVVGLVVGPKGATIKRIQQMTHTYIVTPSRDKEPVFEVTGKPENVEKARQEIEKHIAMRTGGSMLDGNTNVDDINDFHTNGIDSGFHEPVNNELLAGLYKNPTNSAFTTYNTALNNSLNSNNLLSSHSPPQDNIFSYPTGMNGTAKMNDYCNGFNIYDNHDEGFASPTFHPSFTMWQEENGSAVTIYGQTNTTTTVPRRSGSIGENNRISPPILESNHPSVRRISSDPLSGGTLNGMPCYTTLPASNFSTSTTTYSNGTSSSPVDSSTQRKGCLLCSDTTAVAAFVPCGHNRLCMKCANCIMKKPELERKCPVCDQTPTQAIRIFS